MQELNICEISLIDSLLTQDDVCLDLASEMKKAASSINALEPFTFFDIHFTEEEAAAISKLRVSKEKISELSGERIEYTGFELETLNQDVKSLIERISEENNEISQQIADLITKLVTNTILSKGSLEDYSAIILIRPDVDNERDTFTAHSDSCLDDSFKDKKERKNICFDESLTLITLKGPTTIMYPLSMEKREEFYLNMLSRGSISEKEQILNSCEPASASNVQGTTMLLGGKYGAVHTVPVIEEERLFIAILPDSKAKIAKFKAEFEAMRLEEEKHRAEYEMSQQNNAQ